MTITDSGYVPSAPENLMAAPNPSSTPLFALSIAVAAATWVYWPTVTESLQARSDHPDDWHYGLIPILSVAILWFRRDFYPSQPLRRHVGGLLLIGLSIGILIIALQTRLSMLMGISLVVWACGVVWLLGGFALLKWAWPSVVLLAFVIPIPLLVALKLSGPLEKVSTSAACYLLQVMRYSAIEVGSTVVLGASTVNVASYHAESCVLHSTLLVGFAWLTIHHRTLFEGAFLLSCVVPIVVIITATRVAAAALALQPDAGVPAQLLLLAYARLASVPAAVLLFASLSVYFAAVTHQVEDVEIGDLIRLKRSELSERMR